jgi:hypothetical protein
VALCSDGRPPRLMVWGYITLGEWMKRSLSAPGTVPAPT